MGDLMKWYYTITSKVKFRQSYKLNFIYELTNSVEVYNFVQILKILLFIAFN
jgi:hypothetical protein